MLGWKAQQTEFRSDLGIEKSYHSYSAAVGIVDHLWEDAIVEVQERSVSVFGGLVVVNRPDSMTGPEWQYAVVGL